MFVVEVWDEVVGFRFGNVHSVLGLPIKLLLLRFVIVFAPFALTGNYLSTAWWSWLENVWGYIVLWKSAFELLLASMRSMELHLVRMPYAVDRPLYLKLVLDFAMETALVVFAPD